MGKRARREQWISLSVRKKGGGEISVGVCVGVRTHVCTQKMRPPSAAVRTDRRRCEIRCRGLPAIDPRREKRYRRTGEAKKYETSYFIRGETAIFLSQSKYLSSCRRRRRRRSPSDYYYALLPSRSEMRVACPFLPTPLLSPGRNPFLPPLLTG